MHVMKDRDLGTEMLRKTAEENIWIYRKCREAGGKCIKRSFVICTLRHIILG
jgi:hypothetical protein